jgi:hypothetical protein
LKLNEDESLSSSAFNLNLCPSKVVDDATENYLGDDGSGSGGRADGGSGGWIDVTEDYVESGGDAHWLRMLCEKGVAN